MKAKLIKSSKLEIIKGMGHLLDEEAYMKFQNQLITFLQSRP